jgi:hypothetical protein
VEPHGKDKLTVWKPNLFAGVLVFSFHIHFHWSRSLCLFIYLWFKDAVASSGGLIGEKLIFSNFEGIGRDET